MFFGTDLAMERREIAGDIDGITHKEYEIGDATVSIIEIGNETAAEKIGKPAGKYVTVSVPSMLTSSEIFDGRVKAVSDCLSDMIPKTGTVLVAGLGNTEITSDSLGPKCAEKIFATGHINDSLSKALGFEDLRKVCVLAPGVTGKTGIEATDIIRSVCSDIKPCAVIAVDALAARDISRIGCTVQMTDTGIFPGSGVGNGRKALSKENLGIPVIAIGVPTVINILNAASGLFKEELTKERIERTDEKYRNTVVTVREADSMTDRAAALTAAAINKVLQPGLTTQELYELTL